MSYRIEDLRAAYGKKTVRKLSDLAAYFSDQEAVKEILSRENPVLYEVYERPVPKDGENLTFATTVLFPGKIGNEYYFTKGHFHHQPDSAEVISGLSGSGLVLLRDRQGGFSAPELTPFAAIYSPPGWAHRAVNTSKEKLVFLSICRADTGHDYETVTNSGFIKKVVEKESRVCLI